MTHVRSFLRRWGPLLLAGGLGMMRLVSPERGLEATGPRALLDAAFAIGLLWAVLYTARGVGRLILRRLSLGSIDPTLGMVFAVAAGVGVLAYGVLALGLLGLLRTGFIFAFLYAALFVGWRETVAHSADWGDAWGPFRRLPIGLRLALGVAAAILMLSLLQALTPVWDYDGLMYHLQGPRLFLEAGGIRLLPNLWQANGPLTAEMIYLVGLAAGSEVFAKVFHWAVTVVLLLATFAVARRHLGNTVGWLAGGILLGVPILPIWGSLAYADAVWALFEFLAIAAYLEWRTTLRERWLIVAGGMLGLALGAKYTALPLLSILFLAVLLDSRGGTVSGRFRSSVLLSAAALVVASPWYVKNLVLAGNPVYPFLLGGPGWSADRLAMLMTYLDSFGTGRSAVATLLLPLHLLTQRAAFGTFMSRLDIPNPIFLVAVAVPFLGRDHPFRPLAWIALARFAAWAVGTQQTRFLLPLYPVLSLLSAAVIEAWVVHPRARPWRRLAATGIVAGLVAVTMAYQVIYLGSDRALGVVIGTEAKDSFLERSVYDYAAL
ncbi:MAG TPA: glycosyltransferase family 39 protein, partial [Anaerolineales bacterium]|nr:glycosyltransferase family 39 protein [Anaerolineales bacterium]